MAELAGADESDIRRLGRWNQQALANCYLSALPRPALRTLAGFPAEGGNYYLPRCSLEPPLQLQLMIFPWLEQWNDSREWEKTISVQGFHRLLRWLRIVLLQDVAALWDELQGHPILNHSIFTSHEFHLYRENLAAVINESTEPSEILVRRAIPLLADRIDSAVALLDNKLSCLDRKMDTCLQAQTEHTGMIARIMSGETPFYISTTRPEGNVVNHTIPDETTANGSQEVNSVQNPAFKMSRGLETVGDAWEEWKRGISGPSIESLERNFGAKWRRDPSERKFFSRRMKLIDKINLLCSNGMPEEEAIAYLEAVRRERRWSLDALQKKINQVSS